jgi:hypothetical protein
VRRAAQQGEQDHRADEGRATREPPRRARRRALAAAGAPVDRPALEVRPGQREHRRDHEDRRQHAERRRDHDRDRERHHHRGREDLERHEHGEQQGGAREHHGPPGGEHAGGRRAGHVVTRPYLLPEARDHQQRVVDAQGEAHHRGGPGGEGVERDRPVEQRDDPGAGHHRGPADDPGYRRGHGRAEHEQQHDREDRERDQLRLLGGLERLVVGRARDRGDAGEVRPHRLPHGALHHPLHGRHDVHVLLPGAALDARQDGGHPRLGPEPLDRVAACPRRDHRGARRAVEPPREQPPLALDLPLRAAQHHDDVVLVPERLVLEVEGLLALRAGDARVGAPETVLDPAPLDREREDPHDPHPEHQPWMGDHEPRDGG